VTDHEADAYTRKREMELEDALEPDDELITVGEATAILRRTRQRVHKYIEGGKLKVIKRIGAQGLVQLSRKEVEALREIIKADDPPEGEDDE